MDVMYNAQIGEMFEAGFNRSYIKHGDKVEIVAFDKNIVHQMWCVKVGFKKKVWCFISELHPITS